MRTRRTALTLAATVSLATLSGLTTAPQPAAAASPWVACTTRVSATQHTATIVNQSATSWATVSFFTRQATQACGFTRVFVTPTARLGYNGTTDGATRKQGSGTTPLGTYSMSQSFGLAAPPGTSLPYRQVRTGDYWVEDNDSAYYNSCRTTPASTSTRSSSTSTGPPTSGSPIGVPGSSSTSSAPARPPGASG